jgi:large subunit ribosomal protein L9|tara:strand:+ start:2814 stop:3257 length:444 start_codon:yes stop_codon:yes gene_type:complete
MDVILLEDVQGLGDAGDVVVVKPGFARNKLIPDGVALRASKRNLAVAEERKRVSKMRKDRESEADYNLVDKLSKTEITIEAQVGDDEKMFGSVTAIDIHKALDEKEINIDRHAIELEEPIKSLGIYHVPVKISAEYTGDLKVYVIKA